MLVKETYLSTQIYVSVAAIYLALSLPLSALSRALERRGVGGPATPTTMAATETIPSFAPSTPARSQFRRPAIPPACGSPAWKRCADTRQPPLIDWWDVPFQSRAPDGDLPTGAASAPLRAAIAAGRTTKVRLPLPSP
jgi:hypothetical protein